MLVSCQNTEPELQAPTSIQLRFQETAPALRPDSAVWHLGGESGPTRAVPEADHPELFAAPVVLPRDLGRDTVKLEVWRLGLRTAVFPYAGSGPELVVESVVREQVARDLLVAHRVKNQADPKAYPEDASGVRRVYAECLLSREPMCPEKDGFRPVGMDSAALVDELCRELARRKLPFSAQIQGPFFGWSVQAWKDVVAGRVVRHILTSQDSATLFPQELVVRRKAPLASVVRAGGSAVGMEGRFFWNTASKVEVFTEIRTLQGKDAEGFQVVLPQPSGADTSISLDGRASLRAASTVAAGKYQRIVGVRDDQGRRASWTDTFLVAAPDTARLVRVAGSRTVAFDSAKVWVAWKGEPSRFDSVWVDGILAFPDNGVWGVWTQPAAGSKVGVDLRAKTVDGIWIEDRVEVVRLAAPLAPTLARLPGSIHRVLPFDSTLARVGWREDAGELDSVWIDGALVARGGDATYQKALDLKGFVGVREVVVLAKRGTGLYRDTIRVERRPDTIPPVIVPAKATFDPQGDSIVVNATWIVVDNDTVDTVRIDGEAMGRVGNTYSRIWKVDTSCHGVDIRARDRSGNESRRTLDVPRLVDSLDPVLVARPGTFSRTVPSDTTSIVVAWKATDDRLLKSVWINDSLVAGQDGIFATQVPLAMGANTIRVKAMDASGNMKWDSIVVRRESREGPHIVRISPHGADTTVYDSTDSLEGAWEVADPAGLASVEIAGRKVTGIGGKHSLRVGLPFGRTRVGIRAENTSGLVSRDSFLVERRDRVVPVATLVGPSRDTLVGGDVDSLEVAWAVSDNWAVQRVEIGGVGAVEAHGRYSRKVPLLWGWNTVVVSATDSAGNVKRDSVRIQREQPTGLRLYRDLPTLADSVANQVDSVLEVAYFVSSPVRIDTMWIGNGSATRDASGEYRRQVPLAMGINRIPVLAVDHDGNRKVDTVKVRRRDQTRPQLVRQSGTANRTVDSSTASVVVAWKATDNVAVKRVLINGAEVSPVGDIYSRPMGLGFGANYFTVVAFDVEGNAIADTVVITRSASSVVWMPVAPGRNLAWELPSTVAEPAETIALAEEPRGRRRLTCGLPIS